MFQVTLPMPRGPVRIKQPETVEETLARNKYLVPNHFLDLDFQKELTPFRFAYYLAGTKYNSTSTRIFKKLGTMTPEAKKSFEQYPEMEASMREAIRSGRFLQKTLKAGGRQIHSLETERLLKLLPVRFTHVVVKEEGLEFRTRRPWFFTRLSYPVLKL
ncbi:MAG: hypothetical protein WC607_01150 [Candidatus Micrarchaeia archaeon]